MQKVKKRQVTLYFNVYGEIYFSSPKLVNRKTEIVMTRLKLKCKKNREISYYFYGDNEKYHEGLMIFAEIQIQVSL